MRAYLYPRAPATPQPDWNGLGGYAAAAAHTPAARLALRYLVGRLQAILTAWT